MVKKICSLGKSLGLAVYQNVKQGRTIWATDRRVKIVFTHQGEKVNRRSLGIDVITQEGPGSANIKAFGKLLDVKSWPIQGVLVYGGSAFSKEFRGVLETHGALPIEDLETYVRTYFNLTL